MIECIKVKTMFGFLNNKTFVAFEERHLFNSWKEFEEIAGKKAKDLKHLCPFAPKEQVKLKKRLSNDAEELKAEIYSIFEYCLRAVKPNGRIKLSDKSHVKKLQEALVWLRDFKFNYVSEWYRVRGLVSEEVWQMYEDSFFDEMPEEKELKAVTSLMKKEWRKRPGILKRLVRE